MDKMKDNTQCFFIHAISTINMKPLGEVEEDLAKKTKSVLGFKPSSTFKRSPIGILIYIVCGIIAFISMRSAGVF